MGFRLKELHRLLNDLKLDPKSALGKEIETEEIEIQWSVDKQKKILERVEAKYCVNFSEYEKTSLIGEEKSFEEFLKILVQVINEKVDIDMSLEKSPIFGLDKVKTIDFLRTGFLEFKERVSSFFCLFRLPLNKNAILVQIQEFLEKCRIVIGPKELKSLLSKIKSLPNSLSITDNSQILQIFTEWYKTCRGSEDLKSKLMKTILEYESLKANPLSMDEKASIDHLINSLKLQLSKIPNKSSQNPENHENFQEKCRIGLSEIFKHYSKQQFLLGKNPTFDYIHKNLEVLTLAKFLKFCKDFEIIQANPLERQTRKNSKWPKAVFKQFSDFNKDMYEHHFIESMQMISEFYFNPDYDREHNTDWSQSSSIDKKQKFFELMGFNNPLVYGKKLKTLATHFGVETYSRIPENDASKNYKYNPEKYKKLKMSVDEWKSRKKQMEKNSESPLNLKKNPYVKLQTHLAKPKSLNRDSVKFNATLKPKQPVGITFRALQEMSADALTGADEEFKIENLIASGEDEQLNNYLEKAKLMRNFSEPNMIQMKLPQIIRNSDAQLSKVMSYSKKKKNK